MASRFSAVAGFLAAATLLGSSSFALAPEFSGDLPTILITDRVTDASAYDAPNGDAGDGRRPSSAFLFRNETGLQLASYITLNSASAASDVDAIFNEYADNNGAPGALVGTATISVNGQTSLGNETPTPPYTTAITADSSLTYRNINWSPGTGLGPFDAVGEDAQDIISDVSGPISAWLTWQIDFPGANSFAGSQVATQEVITTIDGVDGVTSSAATSTFSTVVVAPSTDFSAWTVDTVASSISGIPNSGQTPDAAGFFTLVSSADTSGFTPTPGVALVQGTAAGAGITSVGIASTASQVGLAGWTNAGFSATAGNIYRVRLSASGANAAGASAYFSAGDGLKQLGYSIFQDLGIDPAADDGLNASASNVDVYFEAKVDLTAGIFASLVDSNASNAGSFLVDSYEVTSTTRSGLTGESVVFNAGTVGTTDSGQAIAPLAGPTAFVDSSSPSAAGENWNSGGALNPNAGTSSITVAGSAIAFTLGAQNANQANVFTLNQGVDLGSFTVATLDAGYTVDPSKLYTLDVWLSSSTAVADNTTAPNLILSAISDLSHQSVATYFLGDFDGLTDDAVRANTSDRVYSMVFSPESLNASATVQLNVFLHQILGLAMPANTYSISQITLTQYDND